MKKVELLGKWINLRKVNPIEIEDLEPSDYVILRIEYRYCNFDYKLAWVHEIKDGQVKFNIQDINVSNTPIKITDFCILPEYSSDNFYKTKNKIK